MADDIQPFLTSLTTATRTFAQALPVLATPVAGSPWGPQTSETTPAIDVEAIRTKAIDEGRAIGKRELDAQRAKLAAMIAALDNDRDGESARIAELVASAAAAVVEAWLEGTDRPTQFAPIVRGWLNKTGDGDGAIARVNPADVAAMRAAVGDAMIAVEPDPSVQPGDVRVRGPMLDLTHSWSNRLDELKDAIATAMRSA
ncbi:MAG TPA: FliH/SctL family protein [Kofleriaceae bacterium]|nr:FliH/SctL family protein [Kofleriaceae bacterium]